MYQSEKNFKNFWQAYSVFEDRVELEFKLSLRTIRIDKKDIVSCQIFQPPVIRSAAVAIKLDLADLYTHVEIKRKNGMFKKLRFTPSDPEAFVQAVNELVQSTQAKLGM